jgi:PAS domain S-box-containing protein
MPETRPSATLRDFGADAETALERTRVPAYMVDPSGVIRWLNPAAERLFGDLRGQHMTTALPPEQRLRGQEIFARNLLGPAEGSDNRGVLLDSNGERFRAELSTVPLSSGGHVIGVFGQVKRVDPIPPPASHPKLSPRQRDVLQLLAAGCSTEEIARELHLSMATVRNHIRAIISALGVHSRLEAVIFAYREHIISS